MIAYSYGVKNRFIRVKGLLMNINSKHIHRAAIGLCTLPHLSAAQAASGATDQQGTTTGTIGVTGSKSAIGAEASSTSITADAYKPYGSFFSDKNNVTYKPQAPLSFNQRMMESVGIHPDKTWSTFTVDKGGIYNISYIVRASTQGKGQEKNPPSFGVKMNGYIIPGTQTISSTTEISNAVFVGLVQIPAGATIAIVNLTNAAVVVPRGEDNQLSIFKI